MTEQRKRPELGKLEVGQRVMVRRSSNDARNCKPEDLYTPAVVTKVGRVWVDLESERFGQSPRPRTWRMRIDTQNEDNRQYTQINASFATMEQYEWAMDLDRALTALRDHGINLTGTSRWNGQEIGLAKIIDVGVAEMEEGS